MRTYSSTDIEKIGNTVVYMANEIDEMSKTKLLKLLYLLEESFVKKYSLPFLNIEFEVWQAGPVSRDMFIELSDELNLLKGFIKTVKVEEGTYVKALKDFSDDEFNDNELEMLEIVTKRFGHLSAIELVNRTHMKNSNWYHVAKEKGLLDLFEKRITNSSDEKIDFTWYLDDKGEELYKEQNHFRKLVNFVND